MKRRTRSMLTAIYVAFAALISVTALPAAQAESLRRVAVLTPGGPFDPVLEGLRGGLARLNYVDGKNMTLVVENTKGSLRGLPERAVSVIQSRPDVLVTVSTNLAGLAKKTTSTVPVVFTIVGDPLRSGFIASYASSRNNLTGVASYVGPLSGKRLEVLKDVAPGIKRVLAVGGANDSIAEISFSFLEAAAGKLGIQIIRREVTTREELERVVDDTPKGTVDAIYFVPSQLTASNVDLLINQAKSHRLPLVVTEKGQVVRGALVSYGADFRQTGEQAAKLVVKILEGAKPADIPIEIPERFFICLNLGTARTIGLKIPHAVLERAECAIE